MLTTISSKITSWLGPDSRAVIAVRPYYAEFLNRVVGRRGLAWTVNGEHLKIDPSVRRFVPRQAEVALFEFLKNNIHPGQSVLDVGAFLGIYAVLVGRWVGTNGTVVCFEPTKANLPIIKRHLQFNGMTERVKVVEAAVGDRPGSANFLQYAEPYMNKIGESSDTSEYSTISTVRVVTLDDVCAELDIVPDWIRLDVQGLEFDVLKGARKLIESGRGRLRIVVEIHSQFWPEMNFSREEAVARLNELGLRARSIDPTIDPFAPDNHVELEYIP